MSRPVSAWRKRVDEILSDGEWHVRDRVVRDAMRLVPPGPAFRQAEAVRMRTNPGPRTKGTQAEVIEAGARHKVMQCLVPLVRSGRVETRTTSGVTFIRDTSITKPATAVVSIDVERLLRDQIRYWERAYDLIPSSRDNVLFMLGGDPLKEVSEALDTLIEGAGK